MSAAGDAAQDAFQARLQGYVNGAAAGRGRQLMSLLLPRQAYRRAAPAILAEFRATAAARAPAAGAAVLSVDVPLYAGANRQARRMMTELESLAPRLEGAYVHGSVATGEEIPYSDFDALVILGDAAFESADALADTAWRLGQLRRLMHEFDPLQHHGWFVIAGADLARYCQAWYPAELFSWCRSLLPATGRSLRIAPRDSRAEYRAAFVALAEGTIRQIEAGPPLGDAYRLKGLLSRFMLLPSLYLQARDGTVVFKRESFALAARDFPGDLWQAMEAVSEARRRWGYRLTGPQRRALTGWLAPRPLLTRRLRLAVDPAVLAALPADLWPRAAVLARSMLRRATSGG